jgi:hypothetical protein
VEEEVKTLLGKAIGALASEKIVRDVVLAAIATAVPIVTELLTGKAPLTLASLAAAGYLALRAALAVAANRVSGKAV